ncbi:MAG: acyl-CoA dehydrogenase [Eubacteriaceae bacterium]|nr:acyl-CoA dehydrogenase [Eubacteriaceae bacterium]
MSMILNQDQKDLVALAKEFMEKEVKPHIYELDEKGEFPLELYKKGFELGFHSMDMEEKYGGVGLDYNTISFVLEELAKVDAGFAVSLTLNGLAFSCIAEYGSEEQKKSVSERMAPGGFMTFALTEADSGSNAGALRCSYTRDGDDYIINGPKTFITNGKYGDIHVVFATANPEAGVRGISAFIVEKERAGIQIGKEENKMGLRLSNTCDLFFDNVRVPAANLIGKEGLGFKLAMSALDKGRIFCAAMATGIAQGAFEDCIEYSKLRKPFGAPIATHQAVQFILADMAIQIEAARTVTHNAAFLAQSGAKYSKEAAIAKTFASDMAMNVTTDAVQIFGGYGYSREYPVEKRMRDAKIFQIFEGTNQIQRQIIANAILR